MNFVIDRVTGTLYRRRELPFFEKHILEERAKREPFVWMESRDITINDSVGALVAALFEDDERFVSMDQFGDRLVERFAVITVRGGLPENLPNRAPPELRDLVIAAGKSAPARPINGPIPAFVPAPPILLGLQRPVEPRPIFFNATDLILGPAAHADAFHSIITKARHRLIIHSTFIAENRFKDAERDLVDAVQRYGVEVDVLWGQDETKSALRSTKAAVLRLRGELSASGHDAKIRIHPFSTLSHAKIIVADDGRFDRHVAILGSCNWLYSGFQSYEVSVRLRDPRVVADITNLLAELSTAPFGHWTNLTNELAQLAHDIGRRPAPTRIGAQAALVFGAQHAQYVRQARDDAKRRIVVTSHRFGTAGRPIVVVPTLAAAKANNIDVRLFWGTTVGDLKATDVARITAAAAPEGVTIRPIYEPRLHAKFLAWDDDFAVITSQNWLSADPGESKPTREIGIFLHSTAVGRLLIESLQATQ